jgi:hypothetical protein
VQSLCNRITAPKGTNHYDAITKSSTHGETSAIPSSRHGKGIINVEIGFWPGRATKWDYMHSGLNKSGITVTKYLNSRSKQNEDIDFVLLLHILER